MEKGMKNRSGTDYFLQGFKLIRTKGLRQFVFIPLTINLILFTFTFYWLFLQLDSIFTTIEDYTPAWLDWLSVILWPLAVTAIVVAFSYIFSAITNWIAAPFNGLLAEKVEAHLTGESLPDAGWSAVLKDVPRTLSREWCKLRYYLPRAIGFLVLFFMLPGIGQILWFLFTAWMMAIQYCDYPFDNHKINFDQMKSELNQRKGLSFSFGIIVTVFSMIPVVNLVVMPVAICGATLMYVEQYRQ
jgi:CysZ protein